MPPHGSATAGTVQLRAHSALADYARSLRTANDNTGNPLSCLAAALDASEEFILGLEPGDLIPADMLEEPQGDLGLLAPNEEGPLLRYRRLDLPTRAAVIHLVARGGARAGARCHEAGQGQPRA